MRPSQEQPVFKHAEIPPVEVWTQFKSTEGLGGLTAEDARAAVINYCSVAVKNVSSFQSALKRGMADPPAHPVLLPRSRG